MKITALKTEKIIPGKLSLIEVLDKYLPELKEGSVLAVTSKIAGICEGRVIKTKEADKDKLIVEEADLYLPRGNSKYNFFLTVKNGVLFPSSGIDESNADGNYVLWPKNPQKVVNDIREYLVKRFSLKKVGVVLTDSRTSPLRWGTSGVAITHSGFLALNDYIGKPDIFGRTLLVTKANIMDALATAAVVVMGEGAEQTPLAVLEKLPFVQFQDRNPTQQEIDSLKISLEEDLYAPLLKSVNWQKGKSGSS